VKRVLITGARGFLGRNLVAHLAAATECETLLFDCENSKEELERFLNVADIVFHLAGVNRPKDPKEFETGNTGLTEELCQILQKAGRSPKIVFSSSIQADLGNPYGSSKLKAEETLRAFGTATGADVRVFRLKNLFGKWCRPNYNSVTATFCHNIAHDLPISISDPSNEVELSYVDDVVAAFMRELDDGTRAASDIPSTRIRLDDLAGRIQSFHEMSRSLITPEFAEPFNRALHATYLSYVPPESLSYGLQIRSDQRGSLAEFIKSDHFGQIFVSRTNPGITRGNHYHHTKTEKFFVVEGAGLIRMRSIEGGPVREYAVKGPEYRVVNIPPGVTHSITNVGSGEMVTLFWSSEIFNPDRPDTYHMPVDEERQ
jgi:UDP-2-acetamido-2,6-beta-L-arabino-hexul-4-ose reductase